jgi:diacylglycerol kinase family enzyme
VVGVYVRSGLLWVVLGALALWGLALSAGRASLVREDGAGRPVERRTPAPRRPFLIMNPRSGGGKVAEHQLARRARELGAQVVLLDPERPVDVAELARQAITDGADLVGVAGGDGTQAAVAAVAAEHRVPFMVLAAGTRNHFALDLGLDRDDPVAGLQALHDGVELSVDLGTAGGRVFVNNVSFGVYAAVVQSDAYREDKIRTILQELPDLLTQDNGPLLTVRAGGVTLTGPQAVLVSNNPYQRGSIADLGRRDRLDTGLLGVVGFRVRGAAQAAALAGGVTTEGVTALTATEAVVEADTPRVPVGLDGEALTLPVPVRCRIHPGALRVRVPRHRPGAAPPRPPMDWGRVRRLALTVGRTAAGR